MGTIIKATGISTDRNVRSSIEHAALAAKECIRAANIPVEQIDLLINVGIHRDFNMVEPAMSALIQKEVGLNRDYVKFPVPKAALSFDLMNGNCGVLNAVQIGSSFVNSGRAEYVLVVSSDGHPSQKNDPSFPYATMGAAMLLARSDREEAGFGRLQVRDAAESGLGSASIVSLFETTSRHAITIARDPEYQHKALELASSAALQYAAAEKVDLSQTLLITSHITPDFASTLASRLETEAVRAEGVDGDPHSSSLTFGYHLAAAHGQFAKYQQALFLSAGAGLTSACALYRI